MSSLIKYRVSDVAKDFEVSGKAVSEILEKYASAPKSIQKVLENDELDIIFEYMTQQNPVENISEIMENAALSIEQKQAEKKAAEEAERAREAEEAAKKEAEARQKAEAETGRKPDAPAPAHTQQPQHVPQKPKPAAGAQPVKKVEQQVRRVDTRGSVVDLSRYDERIDSLVPDTGRQNTQNKEKFKKTPDKKPVLGQKRRFEEAEKMKKLQQEVLKKVQLKIKIPDEISVGELAARLKKTGSDVVKKLMRMGIMASVSQIIDFETASLVAMEFDAKVEREIHLTIEERLIDATEDKAADLVTRDPVVVVMGHVDHGKTSLLDAIRNTSVASGEAGGITQHIGAYRVDAGDKRITFLDTPGHEAFTSMRMRGAQVTDIAILVVAADDGIMPQTIEAINHAKAAEVPIIVAINKIDKPEAKVDRIMQQLTEYELVAEEWGGETIVCPVSAVKGTGIDHLLEMILLVAEMRDLKANPSRAASGSVIEAKLDKGRGPVATVLVQNGTLKSGDIIIAGKAVGRVRAMNDDKGRRIDAAGPSVPAEIIGLSDVPDAGDLFHVVEDERMARELVEERKEKEKAAQGQPASKMTLDDLFAQIKEGNIKELGIIVKADVQGSVEAVKASLEKLSNDEVRVRVIHGGVGAINESDVMLASASNAIVIGFNVRPDAGARDSAERNKVDMRMYRVIYECIEEIEAAIKGMLAPKFKENVIGHAQVRQTFKVTGVGTIAGCMVQGGKITRSAKTRLVRDGVVIHEGEIASLKRFKDDVREVAEGYECGIGIERFNDIKDGDIIEAFVIEEIKA